MKSIVREVLSRESSADSSGIKGIEDSKDMRLKSANQEDEELKRVLAGLKTNIKICGCGGAGCNTI
ncbi:MAG: cell division protein FtsZ, partial [Thermoplasmata archaeon]|nr:cell division protein FtsZ [Thermoplasmata archaeon]